MEEKRIYTVGPNTEFILHRKDRVNYRPGQTFSLDHLDGRIIEKLLAFGKVVDVTGMKQEDIDKMVAMYREITAQEVIAALNAAAEGEGLGLIEDDEEETGD